MIGSPSLRAMEKGGFEALHLAVAEQWIGAGLFAEFGKPGFWFFYDIPATLSPAHVPQANEGRRGIRTVLARTVESV